MLDERIPVFATDRQAPSVPLGTETALVLNVGTTAPALATVEHLAARPAGHGTACICCTPRAALAEALHRLFLRRARGEAPFFRRVIVAMPPEEIAEALADPLIASRFRAVASLNVAVGDATHDMPSAFRCE